MTVESKSELKPEFLSILALNPFAGHNSSSRQQMFSSHLSQCLVTKDATEHRFQTGIEYEIGKHTLGVRMPEDGLILKVIERYPKTLSKDYISHSPEKIFVYESSVTGIVGIFTVPYFRSYHQYHGFKLVKTQDATKFYPGNHVAKGTVSHDSRSKIHSGGYAYGIELNIAYMSLPGVSEDGIIVSEDVLDRMSFNTFEKRVIEFGKNTFPLNMYGDDKVYRPFPEIGDMIRDDGVLMALREYRPDLAPVEMSFLDCREIDYIFDKQIYTRGKGGRVIDIKVYHDDNEYIPTPREVCEVPDKYARALRSFYNDILEAYKDIKQDHYRKYGEKKLRISPEFHRLLIEAYSVLGRKNKKGVEEIEKVYRRTTLDDYRVEITVEYTLKPDMGNKITDIHG